MTTDAVTRDVDMVEVGRQPARGRMAILAVVAAADVCRILAGRNLAIMTGAAGTDDLRVVNGIDRVPDIGIVAVLAKVRRLDMRCTLAGGFDAVVATEAITGDADVVEIRG